MSYRIEYVRDAAKSLSRIGRSDRKLFNQLRDAIDALADNPRPHGFKPLTGREGYRIRVREYRVIYEVNEESVLVTVVRVGPRGAVYD
ncbi:MAG: type II toxin-antitoxin system RelE/ParE family toxin [Gordonia sp. (in: high G+C Gram-positive bacteria)]|uniref:type II toxin-antitoxin system RelE family toxin n=1 Tax=Gordonia sp. (in: high G+C Gram-positive bacteria) TaxID=84139 RepID=UPI003BB62A3B